MESECSENKSSLADWRDMVESAAAFATSGGGEVRIGIGPSGERTGVRLGKGTLEDLANKIKVNTDPPQFPSITVEGTQDCAVVKIRVEESPIKPVWGFGRPLKRVGRTNQHVSRGEAQRMTETTTGRTWDAMACQGFRLDEMDKKAVREYLRRTGLKARAVETLLRNLALLTPEGAACNGAALLFARHPERFFPEAQVKCGRFAGTTSVRFLDEKTFEGNLLSQMDQALGFVARNTRQGIRITGRAERETIPEYPEDAVREAIVNAICHRDYGAVGTVQVRIYDDRLEVWNPGTLPPELSIESLSREHPSRPRNPRLAQALYRARLIEHWGTGTLRMIQAAKDRGMNLEFGQDGGVFMARFIKTAQVVSRPADVPISARQERVLGYLAEHGTITRREYRALVQVSERQSLRDLTEMMERGILVRSGKGRTTCYRIPTARLVRD
jgi:ATP-dependent DNA helicase RecG